MFVRFSGVEKLTWRRNIKKTADSSRGLSLYSTESRCF